MSFLSVDAEERGKGLALNAGTDDTQTADDVSAAYAHIVLLGNIVKVDPLSVFTGHNTLGAKNCAVLAAVKRLKSRLDLHLRKGSGGLASPVGEDLVGVVMVMAGAVGIVTFVVVVVMMLVLMMMATALALVVMMMLMLMLMLMVVMMATALALVVMMMLMLMVMLVLVMMATALALMVMMMLMLMVMLVLMMMATALALMVMMVLVLMMMATALTFLVVVMMVMVVLMLMLCLLGKTCHLGGQGVVLLHGVKNNLALQRLPRGGDDGGLVVLLAEKGNGGGQLVLVHARCAAEDDGLGVLDLIAVKLAKVLHVNTALGGIGHGNGAVQHYVVGQNALHSTHNVRKLANARGLDEDAVGGKFTEHLAKGFGKVAHKAAANTAAVHLGDLNARLAEETAVNADLTELVLNENHLLARIGFGQQLFDQRRLARTEKSGKYINFSHVQKSFLV